VRLVSDEAVEILYEGDRLLRAVTKLEQNQQVRQTHSTKTDSTYSVLLVSLHLRNAVLVEVDGAVQEPYCKMYDLFQTGKVNPFAIEERYKIDSSEVADPVRR